MPRQVPEDNADLLSENPSQFKFMGYIQLTRQPDVETEREQDGLSIAKLRTSWGVEVPIGMCVRCRALIKYEHYEKKRHQENCRDGRMRWVRG
jgi:hypothetical protein